MTFITKDGDFVDLLERLGPPPRVIWVTRGNSSNAHPRGVFDSAFGEALTLLDAGAALVEIADAQAKH